jgi:hypothetical protein
VTDQSSVFPHLLAALVLLSRLADVISTYLVSPTLALEANPLARRGGWPFALSTLLVCLLPYYSTATGVVALTVSMLVAGSNLSRCWVARALGEAEYRAMFVRAASRGERHWSIVLVLASSLCPAIVGLLLMWLSSPNEWGYWFGTGILLYGAAIAVYGTAFVVRLFREVSRGGSAV